MRILLMIKRFDFGGAENHVCELANVLSGNGNDVILIAPIGRQRNCLSARVHFIRLKLRSLLLPFQVLYIISVVRKNRIQVIHAHQNLAVYAASLAGWFTGIPVIATVHGRTRYDLRSALTRNRPEKLIFVSRRVQQASPNYDKINSKSVFIPNGISRCDEDVAPIPYRLCYMSRIDHKHARLLEMIMLEVLVPLSKKYPDLSMMIAGDGKKLHAINKLADKINRESGRELCYVAGYQRDLSRIASRSSLVLGAGRIAIAGLAGGNPMLSVNINRLGGMVSTSNYYYLKENNFLDIKARPPDAETLSSMVEGFFENENFWKEEAGKLKDLVTADFELDAIVKQIEQVYAAVVNARK